MLNNFNHVFNYLNRYELINIIDVGSSGGSFRKEVISFINNPSFWVGIDPDPNVKPCPRYDLWFELAIDNVDYDKISPLYINADSYCNSLLEINKDILTNDFNKKNDLWFCQTDISKIIDIKNVKVTSLSNLIKTISILDDELLHFIKIDAQGVDIRVVQSLGEFINKTLFIMIETVKSDKEEVRLYKTQNSYLEDHEIMTNLGFIKLFEIDYTHICPESDVVYYNKNLVKF